MKPLAIIPVYLAEPEHARVLSKCTSSIRKTAGDSLDILLVDDHSPRPDLLESIERQLSELQLQLYRKEENSGYAATVNVGLRRCLTEGRDAVLVNQDIEFFADGWLEHMVRRREQEGKALASVVGGLLLYPEGTIQHAGICLGALSGRLGSIYKHAPGDLPEARLPRRCPVTAALQFIRNECLQTVGLYDESFTMAFEDVDYCLRTLLSGRECVYDPDVSAYHVEGAVRDRHPRNREWLDQSQALLDARYSYETLAQLVPQDVRLECWELALALENALSRLGDQDRKLGRTRAKTERLKEQAATAKRRRDEVRDRLATVERTRLWRSRTFVLRAWVKGRSLMNNRILRLRQ